MNEAQVVRKIIAYLNEHFGRHAVIFKHCDKMTAGIPDISVTYGRKTFWLEVKLLASREEPISVLRKKFDALQLASMRRLESQGLALYLVAVHREGERGLELDVCRPSLIAQRLEGRALGLGAEVAGPFIETMTRIGQRIREGWAYADTTIKHAEGEERGQHDLRF